MYTHISLFLSPYLTLFILLTLSFLCLTPTPQTAPSRYDLSPQSSRLFCFFQFITLIYYFIYSLAILFKFKFHFGVIYAISFTLHWRKKLCALKLAVYFNFNSNCGLAYHCIRLWCGQSVGGGERQRYSVRLCLSLSLYSAASHLRFVVLLSIGKHIFPSHSLQQFPFESVWNLFIPLSLSLSFSSFFSIHLPFFFFLYNCFFVYVLVASNRDTFSTSL